MKNAYTLIDLSKLQDNKNEEHAAPKNADDNATTFVINWLFKELKANYPAFRHAWPDDETFFTAKRSWLKAFVLAGITKVEQLQHALNKILLMDKPFVPTVGEFISWCNPSPQDLGFPLPTEAFRLSIILNQQFSNYTHSDEKVERVIRHAIEQIGTVAYRSMPETNAREAFNHYYDMAIKQFLAGNLKEITRAIAEKPEPHPSDKQRSDIARIKAMESIKKCLGVT